MINFTFPTSKELRVISPEKIPNLERDRPTFSIFPTTNSQDWELEWEQRDTYRGLQQLRGLNGEPSYVKTYGFKRFSAKPGVYGEYMTIDEEMMTKRAAWGRAEEGNPISIDDLVMERTEILQARETDLVEFIHWQALLYGQFTFLGPTGAIYSDQFAIQQATFSDWSNLTTATPLKDLLGLKLLARGRSVSFGTGTKYFMNHQMVQYLILNRNPDDLGGQLSTNFAVRPLKSLEDINATLGALGLGMIMEYDETYLDDNGQRIYWIPNRVISIVGQRTSGEPLGEYRKVRNAQNADLSSESYEIVIDHLDRRIPRLIEVHRGHNGGLVIFYPSAIVRANA